MTEKMELAAQLLANARRIVVFTGAGISTESGIPDFRSPGGVWSRYNQEDLTYQKFRSHEKYRKLYWEYDNARFPAMRDAEPNEAHKAIVELEKSGRLSALITQNIDGLHQKAGNSNDLIYELHGTVHSVTCLDCGVAWPRNEVDERMTREKTVVPYCPHCNGPLKCGTIAFGQRLPEDTLQAAFQHAAACDVFLTIGSSLVVQPANLAPLEAKRHGARLVLVNMTPTPYDGFMDVTLTGQASPLMKDLITEFKNILERRRRKSEAKHGGAS